MALAEEVARVLFTGSGAVLGTPFPLQVGGVPITYADRAHLVVTRFDTANVPTVMVDNTDYDLSADSVLPPVGTTYPQTVSAADLTLLLTPLAIGEHLLVERITPRTQEQVLTRGGGFRSAANERAYDAMVRQMQELQTQLDRTLKTHPLDAQGALSLDLAADERDETMLLGFAADGSLAVVDRPTDGADGATGATGATGPTGPAGPAGSGAGDVLGPATNTDATVPLWNGANTKTLKNATPAEGRTALGLGSSALLTSAQVFQVSNNLSEGVAATKRTNLGLGTIATQDANAVAITGGVITGITDLAVADGGSGSSTAAGARTNFGLGSAAVLAECTTAEYRSNTADRALSTDQVWAAGAHVALTNAATVLVDFSLGLNFDLAINGNYTLGNPSNAKIGQCGVIAITQDATGNRTLAYASDWEFAGGSAPVLSTTHDVKDLLHYEVLATGSVFGQLIKDVR